MSKLPALKAKDIIRLLLRAGFYIHHQKGGHVQLRSYRKSHLRITIPRHDRFDLPPFVLNSILKQAEIKKEIFLQMLLEE